MFHKWLWACWRTRECGNARVKEASVSRNSSKPDHTPPPSQKPGNPSFKETALIQAQCSHRTAHATGPDACYTSRFECAMPHGGLTSATGGRRGSDEGRRATTGNAGTRRFRRVASIGIPGSPTHRTPCQASGLQRLHSRTDNSGSISVPNSISHINSLLYCEPRLTSCMSSECAGGLTSPGSAHSDILGDDIGMLDFASTAHILQQDLSNLTLLGRGGCGIAYHAEWRGASVAVKFIVSDNEEKLQCSVMEAITSRILAHPHVVHTYAALVIPVDHAWLLIHDPEPCHIRMDPTVDLQVEQLFSGCMHNMHNPSSTEGIHAGLEQTRESDNAAAAAAAASCMWPWGQTACSKAQHLCSISEQGASPPGQYSSSQHEQQHAWQPQGWDDQDIYVPQALHKPLYEPRFKKPSSQLAGHSFPSSCDGGSAAAAQVPCKPKPFPMSAPCLDQYRLASLHSHLNEHSVQPPLATTSSGSGSQLSSCSVAAEGCPQPGVVMDRQEPLCRLESVGQWNLQPPHKTMFQQRIALLQRPGACDDNSMAASAAASKAIPDEQCFEGLLVSTSPHQHQLMQSGSSRGSGSMDVLVKLGSPSEQAAMEQALQSEQHDKVAGSHPLLCGNKLEPSMQLRGRLLKCPAEQQQPCMDAVSKLQVLSACLTMQPEQQQCKQEEDPGSKPEQQQLKQEEDPGSRPEQQHGKQQEDPGSRPEQQHGKDMQLGQQPGSDHGSLSLQGRLSQGSAEFSLGNSQSGCTALSFAEAMGQLNLQPGQYVTCIVMEFCDRCSLADVIKRKLFIPSDKWGHGTALRALVRTAKELAQGLSYLHSMNIMHGDLKPGNVLLKSSRLDRRGFTVRLSDFGYSTVGGQEGDAMPGVSTLAYTAPEAVDKPRTVASDLWSYGVLLYEMMTAEQPFLNMHWGQLLAALLQGEAQLDWSSVVVVHPVQHVLKRLGMSCTSQDPSSRPTAQVISKVMVKMENALKASALSSSSSIVPFCGLSPSMSMSMAGADGQSVSAQRVTDFKRFASQIQPAPAPPAIQQQRPQRRALTSALAGHSPSVPSPWLTSDLDVSSPRAVPSLILDV